MENEWTQFQDERFDYKKSKWGHDIDTAIYWLAKDLLSSLPDRGSSPEYKHLEAWTVWMIQIGHQESDEIVKMFTQEHMPYVTDDLWENWVQTVNNRGKLES